MKTIYPLQKEEVIWRRIGDTIVVIKEDGLSSHTLNKTASFIWELCDGNNGNIDLRDYFIVLSNSGNVGTQNDEANQINVTIDTDTNSFNHSHTHDTITAQSNATTYGHTVNEGPDHSHSISGNLNHTPEY